MTEPTREATVGTCSYCGQEAEMEPEHVVPRAIFVNENQSTIVIPACHCCNNSQRRAPARTTFGTGWWSRLGWTATRTSCHSWR